MSTTRNYRRGYFRWPRRTTRFYEVQVHAATVIKLVATPLQPVGWAYFKVIDYEEIERSRLAELDRVQLTAKCWAFDTNDETGVDKQSVQIARLIAALGEGDSGRRAILRAVAGMQGIVSDKALESLYEGTTEEKLIVPPHIRAACLHQFLAPVNLFEIQKKEPLYSVDDWNDLEFEVALDSGAVVHACGPGDFPGV